MNERPNEGDQIALKAAQATITKVLRIYEQQPASSWHKWLAGEFTNLLDEGKIIIGIQPKYVSEFPIQIIPEFTAQGIKVHMNFVTEIAQPVNQNEVSMKTAYNLYIHMISTVAAYKDYLAKQN